jgi:hypothetical protein
MAIVPSFRLFVPMGLRQGLDVLDWSLASDVSRS